MDRTVTRPILWNVPVPFIVMMYGLLVVLVIAFIYVGWRWYRRVSLGSSEHRFNQSLRRFYLAIRDGVGQALVVRESWGWMHYTFLIAFIGLFIGTALDLAEAITEAVGIT